MARRNKSATAQKDDVARFIRVHGVLLLCIAIIIGVYFMLPSSWEPAKRFLLGWDVGNMVYLGFALATIARFELKKAQDRAADQDEGAIFILIITVVAAAVSLAAIVALLGTLKDSAGAQRGVHFTLAALTIMISWILIHVMFALHYAHEFYGGEDVGRGGGLKFPGDPRPDYWDFVYFSFVIGMTFQVSDVQVTGKHLRRLVVAHGVVAFFFNVAILALAVNIGSQMI